MQDALGHSITSDYDAGVLTSITDPLRTTALFRDALGWIIGIRDALGNVSRTEYEPLDRVQKSATADLRLQRQPSERRHIYL